VGLSADTANAHFGGVFRRGKERVLTKNWVQVKQKRDWLHLQAHVIHNYTKWAYHSMGVDVGVFCTGIWK
jgi:hypothetical protein